MKAPLHERENDWHKLYPGRVATDVAPAGGLKGILIRGGPPIAV